jgi:Cu2+-exporting ATPase
MSCIRTFPYDKRHPEVVAPFGFQTASGLYRKTRYWIDNKKKEYKENIQNTVGFVSEIEEVYHKFIKKRIDPLFGDPREEQLKNLSLTDGLQISQEEKKANRHLGIATVNIGIAVVLDVFYPPLLFITVPVILWLCMGFFKEAFHSIFKAHQVNISLLEAVQVAWTLLSGYYFSASLATFLFTSVRKLMEKAKERSQNKLINVFGRRPDSVWILSEGVEVEIPFEKLREGDIFVVSAGEMIPADGTIKSGTASVDQHLLTGESQPADKNAGDQVFASTVVLSGKIEVLSEKAGQETVAAQIGKILNSTTCHKTSLESDTEKVVDQAALPTLMLVGLAFSAVGTSGSLAILFTSMGYNMRVLGPMSILSFLRIASEKSILIKDGQVLEKLLNVSTVIFDKTGTLTLDQPYVECIHCCSSFSKEKLLTYAAAAEKKQQHPVARAILAAAEEQGLTLPETENTSYEIGFGIRVNLYGSLIRVGSGRFMEMENISVPDKIQMIQTECGTQGYSLIMIAVDNELAGAVELRPTVRPEAKQVIQRLRQSGISTYIISGDQEEPTRMLAQNLQIDHFFANTLPKQKAEIIEQLQKDGKYVCFIGDGINDSIALKKADVSVSLCNASTAALDSAQIILMDGNLNGITHIFDISRKFAVNQKTNLAISVIPGVICIGGVFLLHFGLNASMILYYLGLTVGIGNATHPLNTDKPAR